MYNSFYVAFINAETTDYGLLNRLPHRGMLTFKIRAADLADAEQLMLDLVAPKLNAAIPADWTLRTIEKQYCYSQAEMEMGGDVDFDIREFDMKGLAKLDLSPVWRQFDNYEISIEPSVKV